MLENEESVKTGAAVFGGLQSLLQQLQWVTAVMVKKYSPTKITAFSRGDMRHKADK